MSIGLIVIGLLLSVPFTIWVPGFRRLWRRREPWVFAVAQLGAVLLAVASGLRHSPMGVVSNGGWAVGLTVAYVLEGRKRLRSARPSAQAP